MARVEILPPIPEEPSNGTTPPVPAEKPVEKIYFTLEDGSGEAVFRVPTLRDALAIERETPGIQIDAIAQKLAKLCVIEWGGSPEVPPDSEIDITDFFAIQEAMAPAQSEEFEVLSDKSHAIQLSAGMLILKRPTAVDYRRIEQLRKKPKTAGEINIDVVTACALCVEWWDTSRSIMPADLHPLSFTDDYGRLGKALLAFFPRTSKIQRR